MKTVIYADGNQYELSNRAIYDLMKLELMFVGNSKSEAHGKAVDWILEELTGGKKVKDKHIMIG